MNCEGQRESYANCDPARERIVDKHVLILVSALPGRLVLGLDLSRLAQQRGNTQITSSELTISLLCATAH